MVGLAVVICKLLASNEGLKPIEGAICSGCTPFDRVDVKISSRGPGKDH